MNKNTIQEFNSRQHMINSDYEIYHYKDIGFYNVSMHHHDFYELYYLISGEVQYYIDGEIHKVSPGNIVLIDTTKLHQLKIDSKNGSYERIVLWIEKDYLKSLSSKGTDLTYPFNNEIKQSVIHIQPDLKLEIHTLFEKFLKLKSYNDSGEDLLSRAYMTELMVHIYNSINKKTHHLVYSKSMLIESIVEYISQNLHDEITIDGISGKFFISKYHLSREFKKYMQITIHKYIKLKRLIKAKELIRQNLPITEVYIKSGFGDYSNFFRAFKLEYGITPKEYYKIVTNETEET